RRQRLPRSRQLERPFENVRQRRRARRQHTLEPQTLGHVAASVDGVAEFTEHLVKSIEAQAVNQLRSIQRSYCSYLLLRIAYAVNVVDEYVRAAWPRLDAESGLYPQISQITKIKKKSQPESTLAPR